MAFTSGPFSRLRRHKASPIQTVQDCSKFIDWAQDATVPFVQDVGVDRRCVDVFMTKKLLDRAHFLAPSSGFVTDEWQLRVSSDGQRHAGSWSEAEGIAAVAGPHPAGEVLAKGGLG